MVVEIRADDPRTDLLTGTPFYAWAPYVWYAMTVVLGTYFGLSRGLFFLRLLLFRSSVQTHRWELVEEPPRVERALRGGCSSFLSFSRGALAPRHRLCYGTAVVVEDDARAQVVPVVTGVSELGIFLSFTSRSVPQS